MTYQMNKQEAMALLMGDRLTEEHLSERFSRVTKLPKNIGYEITKDIGLLHQYFLLRNAKQDIFDEASEIVVARMGRQTIAGCRMTLSKKVRTPSERIISLEEAAPELAKGTYIEISAPAILPDYQDGVIMVELFRSLIERGAELGALHAVTIAPVPLAKSFTKAAALFGLTWSIHNHEIPAGDYESNLALYTLDLASVQPAQAKKAAQFTEA